MFSVAENLVVRFIISIVFFRSLWLTDMPPYSYIFLGCIYVSLIIVFLIYRTLSNIDHIESPLEYVKGELNLSTLIHPLHFLLIAVYNFYYYYRYFS